MIKRLICLYLDIICLPGIFLAKKNNALYHLKYVCPRCPQFRREMRDLNKNGLCWWQQQWERKNYHIPRSFGIKNWLKQYLYLKTDLSRDLEKF